MSWRRTLARIGLVLLLLAVGVVGLRFWRLARRVRQLQVALREAARHPAALAGRAARKQFSPGFLQMAFGDNPPLLAAVTALVADAQRRDPALGESRVTVLMATYRPDGGAVREVAIRLVGLPELEENIAGVNVGSEHGQETARQVYQLSKSLLGALGNQVRLVTTPENEDRERRLMEAVVRGQAEVVAEQLREPLRFVAVVPDPEPFVGESSLVAVLLKGELSAAGGTGELIVMGYEARRAAELAGFLEDTRMLAGGLIRLKFTGGPVELLVRPVARAEIGAEGPTVRVRTVVSEELMEIGLPRLVKGLGKALSAPVRPE